MLRKEYSGKKKNKTKEIALKFFLKFFEFQFNNAIIFKSWIDTTYLIYIDTKSINERIKKN